MQYFKNKPLVFLLFLFLFLSFFLCCKKNHLQQMEREDLFSLSYGSFENQINLFELESSYTRPDSQISMKDGIFYISNSASGKIMQMTSFGDLLSIIYNVDKNPQPIFTNSENSQTKATTRKSVQYPLNHPTFLAITDNKQLYVVDSVFSDRVEYDPEENLALTNIVIHFNEESEFVNYIGQEGIGGTPFPIIEGLYTNTKNDIIVVCRTTQSIKVYWFSADGELLYKVPIFFSSLPSPYREGGSFFSSVETVVPDFNAMGLYVKIDYYTEEIDPETQVSAGINYDKSCLYFLAIETGKYENKIDIAPHEETETDAAGTNTNKKVFSLIGISQSDKAFFITPTAKGYLLGILDLNSLRLLKRDLIITQDEQVYNALNLSTNGILSGLLAKNNQAEIVWWRTDKIIGESIR
ncbi:hypothetical protein DWQ65_11110 [Treponema phagedenis]|nr:hypothetical protein DWQ65_11110 [Treponema phagedenis]